MKFISSILLFCFVVIAVTPLAFINVPPPASACENEIVCCRAEENKGCGMKDLACCPGSCSPTQCVFCCFVCPVSNDKIVIKIFNTGIKTHSAADQFRLSDFTSECWQPPELV